MLTAGTADTQWLYIPKQSLRLDCVCGLLFCRYCCRFLFVAAVIPFCNCKLSHFAYIEEIRFCYFTLQIGPHTCVLLKHLLFAYMSMSGCVCVCVYHIHFHSYNCVKKNLNKIKQKKSTQLRHPYNGKKSTKKWQ